LLGIVTERDRLASRRGSSANLCKLHLRLNCDRLWLRANYTTGLHAFSTSLSHYRRTIRALSCSEKNRSVARLVRFYPLPSRISQLPIIRSTLFFFSRQTLISVGIIFPRPQNYKWIMDISSIIANDINLKTKKYVTLENLQSNKI